MSEQVAWKPTITHHLRTNHKPSASLFQHRPKFPKVITSVFVRWRSHDLTESSQTTINGASKKKMLSLFMTSDPARVPLLGTQWKHWRVQTCRSSSSHTGNCSLETITVALKASQQILHTLRCLWAVWQLWTPQWRILCSSKHHKAKKNNDPSFSDVLIKKKNLKLQKSQKRKQGLHLVGV